MGMTPKRKAQNQILLAGAHTEHAKGLNAHAFFKIRERSLGEDLVQETFIKTWRYLVRGGKIEVMKAFLYHILNDLIVDEYRKHKTASLDVLIEKGFEPKAAHTGRIFDRLDGKEAVLLIEQLPLKYRKVMRMRHVQELSLAEISILTRQTKNTVAVQLHRGLEKLKLLDNSEGGGKLHSGLRIKVPRGKAPKC
jgi:RNA polymerase sigma-70 factor (ECF subfamily)